MKIEVGLSDLRAAVTSAAPHMAKPNGPGFEDGLGVVRLQLTGHGLLVSATDRYTFVAALIEADVHDDEADPIDLTPKSIKSLLTVFPAPRESVGESRVRVESRRDPGSADVPSEHPPSTVTFTDAGGMFDGDSLTVTEYPSDGFPDVALMMRGLLARQSSNGDGDIGQVHVLNPELLHRFEAASKAFGRELDVRAVPQAPGADRGVVLVAAGDEFLGAVQARFEDLAELPSTSAWLDRLPEPTTTADDPFDVALVWSSSTPSEAES